MKRVFADTAYWIALINPREELHAAALRAQKQLRYTQVFTTDEVLSEVLSFFSKEGRFWREQAIQVVEGIRKDPRVTVDEQSRATFDGGLDLYKHRLDRRYSLVDCTSFLSMRRHGITEALAYDHDFEQEQFVALLRAQASGT
ncbi:MAG: PIN domain-containing protein [Planctomycetes bacterium]|nr:PIN domain-containing protein [Planctomycetota bacterium]